MATGESQSVSPAPSIASVGHHATPVGRPLKSAVWNFFEFNPLTDKSVCQVIQPDGSSSADEDRVCGHCIPGKYPSNLKQHLRKYRPQYSEDGRGGKEC